MSRQTKRAAERILHKAKRHAPTTRKQNPIRAQIMHGLYIAMADWMSPTYEGDKVKAARTMQILNTEFMSRGRGKGGKQPARRKYTKSVAHFA